MEQQSELRERVLSTLDNSARAYMNGDAAFFNYFAKDATIYSVGSTEPFAGRDDYRKKFEAHLTGTRREETVLDRTVQIIGDKAVVTQTAQIKQDDITANVRQTYVLGETSEGLKVVHLHTTLLGSPTGSELPDSPAAIRVLSEKIATVPETLGVAQ
jgi:ketosteroid isomerase-like protein